MIEYLISMIAHLNRPQSFKQQHQAVLVAALNEALQAYQNGNRSPLNVGDLGINNGVFSWFRHGAYPEKRNWINRVEQMSPDVAFAAVVKRLQEKGSLWNNKGNHHSFNNYFLTSLRNMNVRLYKKVVGDAYNIVFIGNDSPTVLFRVDNRNNRLISRDGFTLIPAANKAQMRKSALHGLQRIQKGYTGSAGISTAKTYSLPAPNLPLHSLSWRKHVYKIILPKGHNILAIDIIETAKRQKIQLSPYNLLLREVNVLENIPPEYIEYLGRGHTALIRHMALFEPLVMGPARYLTSLVSEANQAPPRSTTGPKGCY